MPSRWTVLPSPALLGPRQCGKTALARRFARGKKASFYNLGSQPDLRRLQNPELAPRAERGLVVLDEVQARPTPTRFMHTAIGDLSLDHLWAIYPGAHAYPVDDRITVWPICAAAALPEALRARPSRRPSRPRDVT